MGPPAKPLMTSDDPYLNSSASEKLFPQLTMEHTAVAGTGSLGSQNGVTRSSGATGAAQQTLHLVTLREGDRSVTLPSLSIEQNYSQMLSELVMHI